MRYPVIKSPYRVYRVARYRYLLPFPTVEVELGVFRASDFGNQGLGFRGLRNVTLEFRHDSLCLGLTLSPNPEPCTCYPEPQIRNCA